MNSLKLKEKKMNFINRLKYAEVKIISKFVDVDKIFEGCNYNQLFEILSTLKSKN